MIRNNLIELLKTFSVKETKDFRDFLNSSCFNKRNAVTNLYEAIIKFHPGFENKSLTKEYLFEKLFPGKKYNDSSLRVLTHYLTELAEKFLTFQNLESNEIEYSLQLGNVLFERNQYKLSEKSMHRALESLDSSKINAEDFYFYKYRMEDKMTYFRFASNYAYFDKIISNSDWETVFKDLTNYYLFRSMIIYLNTLNIHNLYNKKINPEYLNRMLDNIKTEDYEDKPLIKMCYYLIKMKTAHDHESYYYKLKEIIFKIKKDINKYDLTGAYVQMGLYCSNMISEGKLKFEKERFELYKEELVEKTYLMGDNTMSPVFYRNVVTSAVTLKELEWVKEFIHKYKPELNKKFRDNYFYSCLAQYEFSIKNFEYSLELISKIKYDEIYMKLNSRLLHLQLLYELGFEDTLAASLESFRHFLSNDKLIPAEKKAPLFNFNKYLNKIISLDIKKSRSEMNLLRNSISKEKVLINKEWLLEKVKSS